MSNDGSVNPISVLLVDDHFFVRLGLTDSLRDELGIDVIGQAASGQEAIEQFMELQPDVMLLDLRLPDMRGDEVLSELSHRGQSFRCVILSANDSEEDIYRCTQAGATSYLSKSVERSDLIAAIGEVAQGGTYFPPEMLRKLRLRSERADLTPRELQTLEHLAGGMSNKEIAVEMAISQATVKVHITHVFEKLHVSDRTQAVAAAIQRGMIQLD